MRFARPISYVQTKSGSGNATKQWMVTGTSRLMRSAKASFYRLKRHNSLIIRWKCSRAPSFAIFRLKGAWRDDFSDSIPRLKDILPAVSNLIAEAERRLLYQAIPIIVMVDNEHPFRSHTFDTLADSAHMIVDTMFGRRAVRIDPIKDLIRRIDPPGVPHQFGQDDEPVRGQLKPYSFII
jgi:hypothetical protein